MDGEAGDEQETAKRNGVLTVGTSDGLNDVERDAMRYRWLRNRDLDTISHGGIFAGKTPENYVLNGDDLDREIDKAIG